jgi:hypothetical protein
LTRHSAFAAIFAIDFPPLYAMLRQASQRIMITPLRRQPLRHYAAFFSRRLISSAAAPPLLFHAFAVSPWLFAIR